ncbi:MAG: reverse transcriptase domain-containing protein [Cyanobacteria bacterium J06649_11]
MNDSLRPAAILKQFKTFEDATEYLTLKNSVSTSNNNKLLQELNKKVEKLTKEKTQTVIQPANMCTATLAPNDNDIANKLSDLLDQKFQLMSQPQQQLNNYGTPNYASTTDTMREVARLKAENRHLKNNQREPSRDKSIGFVNRSIRTTDGQPICFKCQRVGHISKYCRSSRNIYTFNNNRQRFNNNGYHHEDNHGYNTRYNNNSRYNNNNNGFNNGFNNSDKVDNNFRGNNSINNNNNDSQGDPRIPFPDRRFTGYTTQAPRRDQQPQTAFQKDPSNANNYKKNTHNFIGIKQKIQNPHPQRNSSSNSNPSPNHDPEPPLDYNPYQEPYTNPDPDQYSDQEPNTNRDPNPYYDQEPNTYSYSDQEHDPDYDQNSVPTFDHKPEPERFLNSERERNRRNSDAHIRYWKDNESRIDTSESRQNYKDDMVMLKKNNAKQFNQFSVESGDATKQNVSTPFAKNNTATVRIWGKLLGLSYQFLIDSGAAISAISTELWNDIKEVVPTELQTKDLPNLVTANQTQMKIHGSIILPLEIEQETYNTTFHVIDGLSFNIIIGHDFLLQNNGMINYKEKKLTLEIDQPIQQDPSERPKCKPLPVQHMNITASQTPLFSKKKRTFRPFSEVMWQFRYDFPTDDDYIFEPAPDLQKQVKILISPAMFRGETKLITLKTTCINDKHLTIPSGSLLGTLTKITAIAPMTEDYIDDKARDVLQKEERSKKTQLENKEKIDVKINPNLTEQQKEQIERIIQENKSTFANTFQDLGTTPLVKHIIHTGDAAAIRQKPYRVSPKQRQMIDKELDKMIEKGLVRKSTSPWASPVVLVPKSNGQTRMCFDYRAVNKVTVTDSHPLPRIDDLLDNLKDAKYFSKIDLKSGFWQIPMEESSIPKTAFTTHRGLYECIIMPFGLKNSPSTFERVIEHVFTEELWNFILVYLDDIIIYSQTFEEHLQHIQAALQKLGKASLKANPEKCDFGEIEIAFLGHVITTEGIKPNKENSKLVREFPPPKNPKQVRSYLGLCSYYRRFIKNFSSIAAPLYHLTKIGVKFDWNKECQESFNTLKERLVAEPIMALPDFNKRFHLQTDASNTGIGYTLSQFYEKDEKAIIYGGRVLSLREQSMSPTEKEALAIVVAVKKLHPYLHGRQFTIWTDHKPLNYILNAKDPTGKLTRWALTLQAYDFVIEYRKGINNGNADGISRIPWSELQSEAKREPKQSVQETILAITEDPFNKEEIRRLQEADPELQPKIIYLKEGTLPEVAKEEKKTLRGIEDYLLDEDILYHIYSPKTTTAEGLWKQLVIPKKFRAEIMRQNHDEPQAAHFGFNKTADKIRRRYFWPGMLVDIQNWINTCIICQQDKGTLTQKAPLFPIATGEPWEQLHCDVVGPFPVTESGNRYVIVFIERLTAWPEAFSVPSTETHIIAELLLQEVIFRFGVPRYFITDQGSNFLSKLMTEVCSLLQIKKIHTSPYHPQSNGIVERLNGTLVKGISHFVASRQNDWDMYLPAVLFAYRTSINASRKESPYFLNFGREATLPTDLNFSPGKKMSPTIEDHRVRIVKQVQLAQQLARDNLKKAQRKNKDLYDQNASKSKFKEGDEVWLHNKARKKGLSPKLMAKWIGPYRITKKISDVNFELTDPQMKRKSTVVHCNRLKPFHDPALQVWEEENEENDEEEVHLESEVSTSDEIEETSQPNTNVVNENERDDNNTSEIPVGNETNVEATETTEAIEDDIYMIEEILKMKTKRRKRYFLIKWEGYPHSENTWEPEENIDSQLVKEFLRNQNQMNGINIRRRFPSLKWSILMILLSLPIILGSRLGPLYDCTTTTPVGVYELPEIPSCSHKMNQNSKLITKEMEVFKYTPNITHFDIHLCTLYKITSTCRWKSTIAWSKRGAKKEKSYHSEETLITPKTCLDAINSKSYNGYRLEKVSGNRYVNHKPAGKTARCRYWKKTTLKVDELTIRTYPAQVIGKAKYIEQHITTTKCRSEILEGEKYGSCQMKESPKAALVWNDPHHPAQDFHSLGKHEIKQMDSNILIPSLRIGGSIQNEYGESKTTLLLDNGILLKSPVIKEDMFKALETIVTEYSKRMASDTLGPILQAHIMRTMMNQKMLIIQEWEKLCFIQKEVSKIQRWMIEVFPTTAARWIHQEAGVVVEIVGEALLVHRCLKISNYKLITNRRIGNSCYHDIPVKAPYHDKIRFLRLTDRQVMENSHQINCSKRPTITYIKNKEGTYDVIDKEGNITQTIPAKQFKKTAFVKIPKIRGYDIRMITKPPHHLAPYSMLNIFSEIHDAMEEVKEIQVQQGEGNLLMGIGKALGSAIQSASSGGSTIIGAIGGGIRDVLDGVGDLDEKVVGSLGDAASKVITSTGGAIKDTGSGIGNIFHGVFGGIGGTIKWVILLFLLGAFAYLNRTSIMKFFTKKEKPSSNESSNEIQPHLHHVQPQIRNHQQKRRNLHHTRNFHSGNFHHKTTRRFHHERTRNFHHDTSNNFNNKKRDFNDKRDFNNDKTKRFQHETTKDFNQAQTKNFNNDTKIDVERNRGDVFTYVHRDKRRTFRTTRKNPGHILAVASKSKEQNTPPRYGITTEVNLTLGGKAKSYLALIDTGASHSLLNREIWDAAELTPFLSKEKDSETLLSITGDEIHTSGIVTLPTSLNNNKTVKNHDYFIVPNLEVEVILGSDILKAEGAIIDFEKKCIKNKETKSPFMEKKPNNKRIWTILTIILIMAATTTIILYILDTTIIKKATTTDQEHTPKAKSQIQNLTLKPITLPTMLKIRKGKVLSEYTKHVVIVEFKIPQMLEAYIAPSARITLAIMNQEDQQNTTREFKQLNAKCRIRKLH